MTRPMLSFARLFPAAAVLLLWSCLIGGVRANERPNLLLIITDQQSADVMSCRMGHEFINTPAMDRLAAGGMLFTRAYSSNPLCMPLRNSLFTGRYPHETGVTMNRDPEGGSLDPKFRFMGTYFRDSGYETAYSGKWHISLDSKDTERHGFEILNSKKKVAPPGEDTYDARVAQAAVEFLQREHDRPYLLVVSLLNPHNICEWARRAAGREQRLNCGEIGTPPPVDQLPPPPANLEPPANEPDGIATIRRAYQVDDGLFPVARFTAEDWRRQRWGYYRMVELVDHEIGKVLDALAEAGEEADTLVVFTSDHGDCTGAHRFNQKTVFYDESVRIPLIVSWEGRTRAATSDKLVNTGIDILPTLLDGAGIEQPTELPGRSVLPLALGHEVDAWRNHIVSENHLAQAGEVDGLRPEMMGRMVRTQRFKYCIYTHGVQRESLVDMRNDPGEMSDLATDPRYQEVILRHRRLLERFAEDHNDPLVKEMLADDVAPRPFVAR